MKKEKNAKKKSAPAASDDRRGRKVFEYVKAPKGIEDKDGIICGVVFAAIKKLKKASVADVFAAAEKGLSEVTEQDGLTQTGVWLNRLSGMGAVKKVAAEGKTSKKVKADDEPKKKFTFKKKKAKA